MLLKNQKSVRRRYYKIKMQGDKGKEKSGSKPFRFFRWCSDCGKKFNPIGKNQTLCFECRHKPSHMGGWKTQT